MPVSWLVSIAKSRHSTFTGHWQHTPLAFAICRRAWPVVPTGKKSSGSVSRQMAFVRHE